MAIDISKIQVFSDSDLLILTRKAISDILVGGQAYGQNNRTFTRADLPELLNTQSILEQRIEDAANGPAGGNIALAVFGDPSGTPGN